MNCPDLSIFLRLPSSVDTKRPLKHPSWEFKGNLGNPDKNRHGTSAGAGTLVLPRIELRKLEAETLEDETRRLQDEKEERVKRLETLNAQAGNIFFGGIFFGVDVGCLCFFCLGVVETNRDVEWGSKNSTNKMIRNLMKLVFEVKVRMDVGGDVLFLFFWWGCFN